MYRVIVKFADAQDKNYIYEVGDEFPRKGKKVTDARIADLASENNGAKMAVIKAVEEKEPEMPPEAPETPQNEFKDKSKGNTQPKAKKPEKGK